MDKVFSIVRELYKLRNIPQFIFIDHVHPLSTSKVRNEIITFKNENPSINEIDVIIESPGGSADDAYRIIRTLRKNFEKVNIIVPFWAKSAATLLALGATTIIMDEFGEFGPLDTQLKDEEYPDPEPKSALIDEYSLKTIENRAFRLYLSMMLEIMKNKDVRIKRANLSEHLLTYIPSFYRPLLEKVNPYDIGSKARALEVGAKYAERILIEFNRDNIVSRKNLDTFIDFIVHGCPDHGYIIDYSLISQFLNNIKESKEIGLDYCKSLTKLSILFYETEANIEYIGFCPPADKKTNVLYNN
jgi:hypothetical protein